MREVKIKKFCSHSCSTIYNNHHRTITKLRNINTSNYNNKLKKWTNEEILLKYNNSNSLYEFLDQLGYRGSYRLKSLSKTFIEKCNEIGINLNKFESIPKENILKLTKKTLFDTRGYQKARTAICKNARFIYKQSNKNKSCIVCKYKKHYEVAHIKPVSEFEDNELISTINNVDNLIALCPNHHWEYDNKLLDLTKYLNK